MLVDHLAVQVSRIGATDVLSSERSPSIASDVWTEEEDSFRTPLNHAGIYGLFLVSELAGERFDPLTEWALSWISDLAQEHPNPPEGENAPGAPSEFIADIQSWVSKLIQAAQERGALAGGFDHGSGEGGHDAARAKGLAFISERLEDKATASMGGDGDYASDQVSDDVSVSPRGDADPFHTLESILDLGPLQAEKESNEVDVANTAPPAPESDAAVDEESSVEEESSEGTVLSEAEADPVASGDSFAFALSVDSATSGTGDVLDLSAAASEIDLLDTAAALSDPQAAELSVDVGDNDTLPDLTLASQTVSSFVTADDFIV